MRLVYTINDQRKAHILSSFLTAEGIENQLEMLPNIDWGSHEYGNVACKIWIVNEDKVTSALEFIEIFNADPDNKKFQKAIVPIVTAEPQQTKPLLFIKQSSERTMRMPNQKATQIILKKSTTFYLIMICCLFFLIDQTTEPSTIANWSENLPAMPAYASPLEKSTLFDYPKAYEIIDKLINLYGADKLQTPQDLPPEGQYLLNEFYKTPYWQGFYTQIESRITSGDDQPLGFNAPLFEKIRQGEIWRLISPVLMHHDILHLLFNMLWLFVIGHQIEQNLGARRYVLMAFMIGIVSNVMQYLVGGANFLGFSGIICGMLTFIWVRQKIAPWEGYPLQRSTIHFMVFFILLMFLIQMVSFFLETQYQHSISPGIANTAHLTGAAIGALLGLLPIFSVKVIKKR